MTTAVAEKRANLREVRRIRFLEQQPARSRGVYKVILLREGPGNPRDRHFYTRKAIEQAARERIFEGLPAYADHPDAVEEEVRPERSIRDMAGWFENAEFVEDEATRKALLVSDLVTIPGPSLQWVRDLLDAALLKRSNRSDATDLVGLSINATGVTEAMDVGGEEWQAVQEFLEGKSVDIVTQAGAGGRVVALKEAMYKRTRESRMNAMQVKQAITTLQDLKNPSLRPVVDALHKVYMDLTHEEPEGGKDMVQAAEAKVDKKAKASEAEDETRKKATEDETRKKASESEAAEGERFASELEARVRALEGEIERLKRGKAAEGEGDEDGEDDKDETNEDISFADWARGEKDEPEPDQVAGDGQPTGEEPEDEKDRFGAVETRLRNIERALGIRQDEGEIEAEEPDEEPDKKDEDKMEAVEDEARHRSSKVAVRTKAAAKKQREDMPFGEEPEPSKKTTESLRVPAQLREATARLVFDRTRKAKPSYRDLLVENAKLKADLAAREEQQEAVAVLKEARIPKKAWPHLFRQIVGLPRDDKKKFCESYRESITALMETVGEDVGQGPHPREVGDGELTLDGEDVPLKEVRH